MKKLFMVIIFVFLTAAFLLLAQEDKKIMDLQKAYVFLEEEMLVNESDLNCSYFIRPDMPQDILIVSKHVSNPERNDFSDFDELVINAGSKAGLKEGDLLLILTKGKAISHPRSHDRLGRFFLKKSLAEITCIYDDNAIIRLRQGCHPVQVGDFAIPFKPEQTVFDKKIDYKYCRIPANAVTGMVVFSELTLGLPSELASSTQYISSDLGEGVVGKGSFLLFYRYLAADLPPLIIGSGVVIHSEKTNSTVKILDCSTDIRVKDRVLVLPRTVAGASASQPGKESIPVVETLPGTGVQPPVAGGEPIVSEGGTLNFAILFPFDGKLPLEDHAADYAAIRDFIAGRSEFLVTLRGYACSIGGDEYNLRLSSQRVEAIKAILVSQYGIDAAHIESYFYGEKDPQFDNSSEAERRKNRLVRIEVNGK
ncbi:MAG: OmpA family protein [Acidobacteria bacterium]|nr:OmpA family protein [Acidobacteriota bacterium]